MAILLEKEKTQWVTILFDDFIAIHLVLQNNVKLKAVTASLTNF